MEWWDNLPDEVREEFILREEELQFLHHTALLLLEPDQRPERLFHFIVERYRELLRADQAAISLLRGNYLEPAYTTVESAIGQRIPISESLIGLCLETGSAIDVPDLPANPLRSRYIPLRGYEGKPTQSVLATPIRVHDTLVAVLSAESCQAGAFKTTHKNISAAAAAQIAIAMQHVQLPDSTALFADADRLILSSDGSTIAIQRVLERIMSELQRLERVQLGGAQILFLRPGGDLEIVHSTHPPDVGLIVPVEASVTGRAVRERKTVIVHDVCGDPDYRRLLGESIRSEIAVPIIFGGSLVIGVLNVESEEENAFSGFNLIALESFAEKVRTLLAFAKLRSDVTEALEMRNADDLLVAVGDQTSHLVHRLNNTVGAMRLRIMELQEMLENSRLSDEKFLRESLDSLLTLADRALQMPEDVTRLLGAGGTEVDINECVRRVLAKLKPPPGVTISLSIDERIPKLPLYVFDLVVQNLIQNAMEAVQDYGEIAISTSLVRPEESGGCVQLIVRDNGIGIPADLQQKVFELNFSTKVGRGKGLGLGLWWVRNFIRRAGGDITVRSTVHEGTEMIVKIPLDRASE